MLNENIIKFNNDIKNTGLTPPDKIITDRAIHQFRYAENGSHACYYPYIKGITPKLDYGFFGCKEKNIHHRWRPNIPIKTLKLNYI